MADLEKVIKGLECCKDPMISGVKCNICQYWDDKNPDEYQTSCNDNLCADALELLKEQDRLLHKKQKDIDKLCADISDLKHRFHEKTEIVRCKDCKFHGTLQCPVLCETEDWFCADGERKG